METINPVNAAEKVQKNVQNATVSKGVRNYRAYLFQTYVVIMIVGFSILAFFARMFAYFPIDLAITGAIQQINAPGFDPLMKVVSNIGREPDAYILLAIVGSLLYVAGLKWEAVVSVSAAAVSTGLNILLKSIIRRPRPSIELVNVFTHLRDSGFPSGHVMFYTTFFGFLLFLSYSLIKLSWQRTLLLILFASLIILVGPSRIYLGEHWASDVFGAYLMGSILLSATIYFYRWGKNRFFVAQPTASN